jgi:FXSXX-COOH protein
MYMSAECELATELADLRQVPLEELHALGDDVLAAALQRVVPEPTVKRVPVAAFNSSI